MKINGENIDILDHYKSADAEGRLSLMLGNYAAFPKMIRKAEMKIKYRIKSEIEYERAKSKDELGVRVQTSRLSDPTFNEASTNMMIEDALQTGEMDKSLLKSLKESPLYAEQCKIISIMRMDYELLQDVIESLEQDDAKILKQYLLEKKLYKEIADDEGRTYEAIKKRMERIRAEIREDMIECLELNCREVF